MNNNQSGWVAFSGVFASGGGGSGGSTSAAIIELEKRIGYRIPQPNINLLMAYIREQVAAEREECAKVCESLAGIQWVTREGSLECADAIRARGQT